MRIVNVIQGSEEWDELRRGVPTASNFSRIITPVKGQLSSSWRSYAAELIAQELGVVVPPPPSFWMEHGTQYEPYAVKAYELMTGNATEEIGFAWPDDHEHYGCSPDRLVGENGLLEVKCPKPETVIEYHLNGILPTDYRPQVQGQLLITGREWCDFVAYHPQLKPFLIRVERDEKYIIEMAVALNEFCENLEAMRDRLIGIDQFIDVQLTDDYQPITYESTEAAL